MNIVVGAERNLFNPNVVTFDERAQDIKKQENADKKALKQEKNSPYDRWTQFNLEHTKELMWLALNHPKAHAILYFLVDQMDNYNAVMCSYKVIEEVLGVGKATVTRNIKVLKDKGFISILKSGTSNVYAINHSVYWKTWGNKKQYSKFPANVILSLSEQEISYKELLINKHKEVITPQT